MRRVIQFSTVLLLLATGSMAGLLLSVLAANALALGEPTAQAIRFGAAALAGVILLIRNW